MQDTKQVTTIDEMLQEYLKKNEIKKLKPRKSADYHDRIKEKKRRILKKERSLRKQQKKEQINILKEKLRTNLTEEQKWFRELYEVHGKDTNDRYKKFFKKKYFPEVLNKRFRYIIELDDRTFDNSAKYHVYKVSKYVCFKLEPFKIDQFINLILFINKIRKTKPSQSFQDLISQYSKV